MSSPVNPNALAFTVTISFIPGVGNAKAQLLANVTGGIFPYISYSWATPYGTIVSTSTDFINPIAPGGDSITSVFAYGNYTVSVTDSSSNTTTSPVFYLGPTSGIAVQFTDDKGTFWAAGSTIVYREGLTLTAQIATTTQIIPAGTFKTHWYRNFVLRGSNAIYVIKEADLYSCVVNLGHDQAIGKILVSIF